MQYMALSSSLFVGTFQLVTNNEFWLWQWSGFNIRVKRKEPWQKSNYCLENNLDQVCNFLGSISLYYEPAYPSH